MAVLNDIIFFLFANKHHDRGFQAAGHQNGHQNGHQKGYQNGRQKVHGQKIPSLNFMGRRVPFNILHTASCIIAREERPLANIDNFFWLILWLIDSCTLAWILRSVILQKEVLLIS